MQKSFKEEKATLYIVSTPIGNLKDITYRAIEILNDVDIILAEDTRNSGILLSHYQIKTKMMSYHEFNKSTQELKIIEMLNEGKDIALISDAGTPGINDPGYEIIKKVIEEGFHVVSIPGASAILSALVVSGLIIQPFTFIGFLPRKLGEQKLILGNYQNRNETLVFYEAPLRIKKTLEVLYVTLGDRKVVLARELTKAFETIIRTTLKEAIEMEHNPKGEYVVLVEGYQKPEVFEETIIEQVEEFIKNGYDEKDAMKAVATLRNIKKSDVYKAYKIEK